jgi:hypothetical protein
LGLLAAVCVLAVACAEARQERDAPSAAPPPVATPADFPEAGRKTLA